MNVKHGVNCLCITEAECAAAAHAKDCLCINCCFLPAHGMDKDHVMKFLQPFTGEIELFTVDAKGNPTAVCDIKYVLGADGVGRIILL